MDRLQFARYLVDRAQLSMARILGLPRRPDWRKLLEDTEEYTMVDPLRRLTILRLIERLDRESVEGCFVECGVARGGVAALLGVMAQKSHPPRRLWLFDSFEGLPEPSLSDGETASSFARGRDQGWLLSIGECVGAAGDVENLLFERMAIPRESVKLVKGWFQHTLGLFPGEAISFLHIDADWYESVKCCLEGMYRYLSDGAYVVVDDYGHWRGARRAVDEFLLDLSPRAVLHRRGYTQAYFRKPR